MKTQRELINEACKVKGITAKKMCEDLKFNYRSYVSELTRVNFTGKKCILISEYLDIDLKTLMTAPIENPKSKKKDEIK